MPTVVYTLANPFDDETGNQGGNTIRYIIPASDLSNVIGTTIKIHLGYDSADWDFDEVWIGHKASSGNVWDFDGNQVQLTFNDGDPNGSVESDGLDSDEVSFSFDGTKDLILSVYSSGGGGGE